MVINRSIQRWVSVAQQPIRRGMVGHRLCGFPAWHLMMRAAVLLLAWCATVMATDWPQHQADAARAGRTADHVAPPFRARWIWLGPAQTLRNRDSVAGWPDDLTARPGHDYPGMPERVEFTIADSVQPVLVAGRVFVGTQEGIAHAIDTEDGTTAWSRPLPGGTGASAAVSGGVVCWATFSGNVVAYDTAGAPAWTFTARRAMTAAPCAVGGLFIVADHGGWVYALGAHDGRLRWERRLGGAVLGGLASDGTDVFVGAEDLRLYALALRDGAARSSAQLRGQSFRLLWPVVAGGFVWAHTVTTPVIGSEYVMESLMAGATSREDEEAKIARWLSGDTDGGAWPDAGVDWRHVFPLRPADLTEAFVPLVGPADGVGLPAHPVVLDHQGRVLTYFKTRYPTLTKQGGTFGTKFSIDVCGIDLTSGKRVSIDNGRLAVPWPWETDNLYGMSVAGSTLWLRQNFRGTQMIDLATSTARGVTACVRHRDGGTFNFDVVYRDRSEAPSPGQPGPGQGTATASRNLLGRTAPIVVGERVYIAENFGITCIEHRP